MGVPAMSSFLWRLKERCRTTRFPPLRRLWILLYDVLQYLSGSGIAWESRFEGPPCFPHGMRGIFVSRTARVGRNCVIFHQVTIGSNSLPDSGGLGAPRIGDDCYLGAGAKIIGGVTLGRGVRVGANAVVVESVPDNSVVVAGKPIVIRKEALDNRFHAFHGTWMYYRDGRWAQETDPATVARLNAGFGADPGA